MFGESGELLYIYTKQSSRNLSLLLFYHLYDGGIDVKCIYTIETDMFL